MASELWERVHVSSRLELQLQLPRGSAQLALCHAPLENRLVGVRRCTQLFLGGSGGAKRVFRGSYAGEQW